MKANLTISSSSRETGEVLTKYLTDRGVKLTRDARSVICYGNPKQGERVLNYNCGTDKIKRMVLMNEQGVRTIPWFPANRLPARIKCPLLARTKGGYGGTDIVPILQVEDIPWRIAAGWDWFSEYVPTKTEYRVWVFRDEFLGVYEKVMCRPHEYKYIGRNFRNGFEFQKRAICPLGLFGLAKQAVKAIGLDFGAVDVLEGLDSRLYVLEVNTAPGVLRSKSEPSLALLADEMVNWLREAA